MQFQAEKNTLNGLPEPGFILETIGGVWRDPSNGNLWNYSSPKAFDMHSIVSVCQPALQLSSAIPFSMTAAGAEIFFNISGVLHKLISYSEFQFTFQSNDEETITLFKMHLNGASTACCSS
jgi:hypothetical protein